MTNIELLMETLHEKGEPPGETTACNSARALLHECTGHGLVHISASGGSGHASRKQGIADVRHVWHLGCLWILEIHGRLLLLLLLREALLLEGFLLLEPLLWEPLLLEPLLRDALLWEALLLREALIKAGLRLLLRLLVFLLLILLLHLWRRRHLLMGLLGWLYAVT